VSRVGVWMLTGDGPRRMVSASLDLEQQLEHWIEGDPALLEPGLTIVGRQLRLEAGSLDLLALDPQGRWIVIEIKRGALRRDTVAQGLDYAACIGSIPAAELTEKVNAYLAAKTPRLTLESLLTERTGDATPGDTRDVLVYVVGTGRDPGLERVLGFLSERGVSIRAFTFDVFTTDDNASVLVRELTDGESILPRAALAFAFNPDALLGQAPASMAPALRKLVDVAQRHGLVARPWKNCVMFAPARNRTRALITVWPAPQSDGRVKVYLSPETFAQFFPVTEEQVRLALQQSSGGSRLLDGSAIETLANGLAHLLASVAEDET
jgi:Holliday junction resolvase-like predicted endonuclease